MENEKQQIALRYKGEEYSDCVAQLKKDGYTHQGFNQWQSPDTGCVYKFVLADGDSYVMRVERMVDGQPELINTEFCDHKKAIEDYDKQHRVNRRNIIDQSLMDFKESVLKTSLSKVLRMLENEAREGDSCAEILIGEITEGKNRKLNIKDYLFYDGVVCFYSPTRRVTHELVVKLEDEGDKFYLYKCRFFVEDLLDSLISKAKLVRILDRETVERMNSKA